MSPFQATKPGSVLAALFISASLAAPSAAAATPEAVWKGAVAKTLNAKWLHAANRYCDHNFCRLERFDIDRSGGHYWDLQRTWIQQGFGDAGLFSIVNTVDSTKQRTDTTDDPMCLSGRFSSATKSDRALEQLRKLFTGASRWGAGSSRGGYVARGADGWEASFGVSGNGSFRAVSVITKRGNRVQRLRFALPATSAKPLVATYGCRVPV